MGSNPTGSAQELLIRAPFSVPFVDQAHNRSPLNLYGFIGYGFIGCGFIRSGDRRQHRRR